ncbi:MAG: NADH-quinone oxidoreductase subunit I [Dehalococcoidia bacterium]
MIGILKGLATTMSTFSRKTVTVEYPDDKRVLPIRQRSFPVLVWDFDANEQACTGCNICVRNCPVDCMTAIMVDNPKHAEGTSDRRKIGEKFWIDYARCMRCNICVEVCPFEAIVMDNNWTGHEHAVYDRLDLHMDIDDLLVASKTGALTVPFRPQDRITQIEADVSGETVEEIPFKFALPEARKAQEERVQRGEGPAIQLREPEKKAAAATAAGGGAAGAEDVEILSERKLRARRMKAEREMQAFVDRGEAVPPEVAAAVEKYQNMKPGVPYGGGGAPAAAGAPAADAAASGVQGDPNSPRKLRARRMRAERDAKALVDQGQEITPELMAVLAETGSDMATEEAKAAVAAASAAPAAAEAPEGGDSPRKLRARRMRAERAAKEALAAGEEVPDDVVQTLASFDITIESLQSGD